MADWFRVYIGTSEDAKFRVVSRNADVTVRDVTATWLALLEDAASQDHRGVATRSAALHAVVLDLEVTILTRIIDGFIDLQMAARSDQGIVITNWRKRQFETDARDPTNALRQQRFRDRHKNSAGASEVTGRGVTGNGCVTPRTEQNKTEDARTRAGGEAKKPRNKNAEKLLAKIGHSAFEREFGQAEFSAGPPVKITVPQAFRRHAIESKFGQTLNEVFGSGVTVVAEAEEQPQ